MWDLRVGLEDSSVVDQDAGLSSAGDVRALVAKGSSPSDAGLARIRVQSGGRPTSISLDSLLYELMVARLGNSGHVREWVQGVVAAVDALEERGVFSPPRDVCAGVSRLVQRQAMRVLFDAGRGSPGV